MLPEIGAPAAAVPESKPDGFEGFDEPEPQPEIPRTTLERIAARSAGVGFTIVLPKAI